MNTQPDPFFVLRDARTLIEKHIAEIARNAGGISADAAAAFARAIGDAHDELAHDRQSDGFDSAEGLTASRLTLMCDADLELDIRIGDISRRIAERCASPLWRAHQRYMTLLGRPDMAPDGNPAGAESLAAGLWAACEASDAGREQKEALLDRIEPALVGELPVMYEALNDLLASHGIEPAQPKIIQQASSPRREAGAGGSGMPPDGAAADTLSALQRMLGAQQGSPAAASGTVPTGALALNAATLVMLNQLNARLEQLQSSGATLADGGDRPQALKAADLDLPAGAPESVALDTLGAIFEAIFEIWDLPDTVKTAIGRLQIPLLRLAICDTSLFSDSNHPARRLINAMGRAALGLPRDIARAHPISSRLWTLAGSVSETLQGDPAVLTAPLAELDALIAERDASIIAAAAPFIAHLQGRVAAASARDAAANWLRETAQRPTAAEFHTFFAEYWVRAMAQAARNGTDGAAWRDAAAVADDLIWSVQPKADPDERKKLAGLVPGLLRRLNAGLDGIGVSHEERKPFLDACFDLQTASLRGAPPPAKAAQTPALSAEALPDSEPVDGGLTLRHLALAPAGGGMAWRGSTTWLQTGQWLQLAGVNGDTPLVGLVAWIGKPDNVLLVNPDWGFALATSAACLDDKRRRNEVTVASSRAIFDEATGRALRRFGADARAAGQR